MTILIVTIAIYLSIAIIVVCLIGQVVYLMVRDSRPPVRMGSRQIQRPVFLPTNKRNKP